MGKKIRSEKKQGLPKYNVFRVKSDGKDSNESEEDERDTNNQEQMYVEVN